MGSRSRLANSLALSCSRLRSLRSDDGRNEPGVNRAIFRPSANSFGRLLLRVSDDATCARWSLRSIRSFRVFPPFAVRARNLIRDCPCASSRAWVGPVLAKSFGSAVFRHSAGHRVARCRSRSHPDRSVWRFRQVRSGEGVALSANIPTGEGQHLGKDGPRGWAPGRLAVAAGRQL